MEGIKIKFVISSPHRQIGRNGGEESAGRVGSIKKEQLKSKREVQCLLRVQEELCWVRRVRPGKRGRVWTEGLICGEDGVLSQRNPALRHQTG